MGIVCTIVYYTITFTTKRFLYYVVIPLSILVFPLLVFELNRLINTLLEFNPNSVDHRFLIMEGSLRMIKENPLLGYGFNVKSPVGLETHNTYLQLLVYGGVPGFLFVIMPIVFGYVNLLLIPSSDSEDKRLKILISGLFFPFIISIFFLSYLTIKFFWVTIMLIFMAKNALTLKYEK
jgi:O-antigen ligase